MCQLSAWKVVFEILLDGLFNVKRCSQNQPGLSSEALISLFVSPSVRVRFPTPPGVSLGMRATCCNRGVLGSFACSSFCSVGFTTVKFAHG